MLSVTQGAEAGKSLEPERQGLQWAEIAPSHSGLGVRGRLQKKKKKRRNSWVVFPRYLEKFVFWARRNGLRYMLWVGECIFSISCFTSKAQQSCMNGRLSALSQELVNMLLKLFSLWMTLALSNRMKRKMAWGYFFPFVNLEVARILVCYLYLGNSLSNFYDYRL